VIAELFHREIDAGDDLIEVVRAEGSPHVSVYTGPFVWQIETRDIGAVIELLGRTLATPKATHPPLALADGHLLHIGLGIERTHIWISAGTAHLRLILTAAHALVAALSEARAHITGKVDAHREQLLREGVKPSC
jgi:hypothetical protein